MILQKWRASLSVILGLGLKPKKKINTVRLIFSDKGLNEIIALESSLPQILQNQKKLHGKYEVKGFKPLVEYKFKNLVITVKYEN